VVIGLDQLMLADARERFQWRENTLSRDSLRPESTAYGTSPFVPFDWSPMTFIFRKGEIEPPRDFGEMLLPRYKGQFALQDPRASSPGLQFFNWVADVEGPRTADFLAKLKPN